MTGYSGKNVTERHSFDAFGLPRRADQAAGAAPAPLSTTRGYTGHEMDGESGLINMNARLYDPELGRFMTPDPLIADVYNLQNLNRYSYVLNNPFRYVDPTGNVVHSVIDYGNGTYYFPETGEWQLNDGTAYSGEWFDSGFDAGLPGIDDAFVTYAPNYTGVGEDFYAEYSDGSKAFVTNEFMNRVVVDPRGFRGQITISDECYEGGACYREYSKIETKKVASGLVPTRYEKYLSQDLKLKQDKPKINFKANYSIGSLILEKTDLVEEFYSEYEEQYDVINRLIII